MENLSCRKLCCFNRRANSFWTCSLMWHISRADFQVSVVFKMVNLHLNSVLFWCSNLLLFCFLSVSLCPAPVYLLLLLCCLCCRYRPSVAVSFVESELGFTEDEQCLKFLQDLGVVFTPDGCKIDCKQSQGVVGASWADPSRIKRPVSTWQVIN